MIPHNNKIPKTSTNSYVKITRTINQSLTTSLQTKTVINNLIIIIKSRTTAKYYLMLDQGRLKMTETAITELTGLKSLLVMIKKP